MQVNLNSVWVDGHADSAASSDCNYVDLTFAIVLSNTSTRLRLPALSFTLYDFDGGGPDSAPKVAEQVYRYRPSPPQM